MAILEKLRAGEGFTDVERNLADFVLEHADEVTRMSITCLAEESFSSNASIVRLCRKLGLDGYRDFRVELAADLERTRSMRRDVDVNHPFEKSGGTSAVMTGLASVMKEAVDAALASTDPQSIAEAARIVRRARILYIFGRGNSYTSALAFANMMLKLGVHCVFPAEYGDELASVSGAMPGDAVMFVSYSGDTGNDPSVRNAMKILEKYSCPVIWVSSAAAPFTAAAELRFPALEAAHGKTGTIYSQTCIRYLLNCLYGAVYALDYEDSSARVDYVDELNLLLGSVNAR